MEEGTDFKPVPRQFDLWPLVQRLLADLRPLAEKEHGADAPQDQGREHSSLSLDSANILSEMLLSADAVIRRV